MASVDDSARKCFTYIWKLENASYCWQSGADYIASPSFTVDEIHETNWKLQIYFPTGNDNIELYLERQTGKNPETVKIDCNLAFLSSDGEILLSAFEKKDLEIAKNEYVGSPNFASRNEVFFERRSVFLPQDTLTVRCRMWKSVGEMSKDVQCFACTRIVVEKRSFLWRIENFSTLKRTGKKSYEVKSLDNEKNFISVELFSSGGLLCDETIRFKIIPNYQNIKMCTFQLSIVDASKNTVKCFQEDFWYRDPCESKDFTLFCTKSELLKNKMVYLPNDVLSLSCECSLCFGTMQEEIEKVDSDCITKAKTKLDNSNLCTGNEFSDPKFVLLDNLKSMLNNSSLSDVKLKTKSQTYPAHTSILGARSPVFKAMFSNDMKEKIKECVDIEDLNDETVLRMLRYIYRAEVEELEWTSATELYEAADKYEILNLRDICSSYLKSNLSGNNACDALLLADMHQDEGLKSFVQKFILRHGKDIINSEEWEQLAGTNGKLVFETMRLKFNE